MNLYRTALSMGRHRNTLQSSLVSNMHIMEFFALALIIILGIMSETIKAYPKSTYPQGNTGPN